MEGHESAEAKNVSIIFSPLQEEAGALSKMLKIFEEHKVNLLHIESRSSTRGPGYEFMAECDSKSQNLSAAIEAVRERSDYFNIISRDYKDNEGKFDFSYKCGSGWVEIKRADGNNGFNLFSDSYRSVVPASYS